MERDVVAPERKIKIPIPAAPINRDLRQDLSANSFPSELKVEDKSSRSGEFKFKHLVSTQRLGPRGGFDTTSI